MALKAGSLYNEAGQRATATEWEDSMAAAMVQAFKNTWPLIMEGQEVPEITDQMRLMFIAVAQGVVRHLVDHPEAFVANIAEHTGHRHELSGTGTTTTEAGQHTHGFSLRIEHEANRLLY